jgi:hypothetical protein
VERKENRRKRQEEERRKLKKKKKKLAARKPKKGRNTMRGTVKLSKKPSGNFGNQKKREEKVQIVLGLKMLRTPKAQIHFRPNYSLHHQGPSELPKAQFELGPRRIQSPIKFGHPPHPNVM